MPIHKETNKSKTLVDVLILPSGSICLASREDALRDCGIDIGQCQQVQMTIDEFNLIVGKRQNNKRKENV